MPVIIAFESFLFGSALDVNAPPTIFDTRDSSVESAWRTGVGASVAAQASDNLSPQHRQDQLNVYTSMRKHHFALAWMHSLGRQLILLRRQIVTAPWLHECCEVLCAAAPHVWLTLPRSGPGPSLTRDDGKTEQTTPCIRPRTISGMLNEEIPGVRC